MLSLQRCSGKSTVCTADSGYECHKCCLVNGRCASPANYRVRQIGTPCNYSYFECGVDGTCVFVGTKHPSHSICGDVTRECLCSPTSEYECYACCMKLDRCSPALPVFQVVVCALCNLPVRALVLNDYLPYQNPPVCTGRILSPTRTVY